MSIPTTAAAELINIRHGAHVRNRTCLRFRTCRRDEDLVRLRRVSSRVEVAASGFRRGRQPVLLPRPPLDVILPASDFKDVEGRAARTRGRWKFGVVAGERKHGTFSSDIDNREALWHGKLPFRAGAVQIASSNGAIVCGYPMSFTLFSE